MFTSWLIYDNVKSREGFFTQEVNPMDGIGYISGPKNLAGTGMTRRSAAIQPQANTSPEIKDGVVSGGFSGSEIQDPRKMFNRSPEIQDTRSVVTGNTGAEITSLNDLYANGAEKFKDMGLNGPGSGKITTLSGIEFTLQTSSPKFLFLE